MKIPFCTDPYVKRFAVCLMWLSAMLWGVAPSAASSPSSPGDPSTEPEHGITAAQIRAWCDPIDEMVERHLAAGGEEPRPITDDATFLRRIYLDLVGRIPSWAEAQRFLSDRRPDKRSALIDQLLASPGHGQHMFHFWADLLRAKHRLEGGNPGGPYVEFLQQALENNTPYDELVRQLLTASGPILEPGHGAVGYYLRDFNMPEDNMANTIRLFLGTRLECAQCHDHPFDKWTQRDFFEMVAFTGGMRMRISPTDSTRPLAIRRELQSATSDPEVRQVAQRILRPLSYGIEGGGTGLARLPDNYQYDDGKPHEIVVAKTLFDKEMLVEPEIPDRARATPPLRKKKRPGGAFDIPGAKDLDAREAFARWLTSPDNPRFTQVIANRMWKKLLGLGLIEPVDDLQDDTMASIPPLLDHLCQVMREVKYDLRQFQRVLCHTRVYQRQATAVDLDDPHAYRFPGPLLRRMTAEQLWDSYLVLAVPDLDTKERPQKLQARNYGLAGDIPYETLRSMSVEEIVDLAEQQIAQRNDPERRQRMRQEMMTALRSGNGNTAAWRENRETLEQLRKELRTAREKKDPAALRRAQDALRKLQSARGTSPDKAPDLVRAAELASPAPVGHFLREFGQSDRDQIANAHTQPAVTQVLSLMNGTIETRIMQNRQTVLMQNVAEARTPADKVDVVFLSLLTRYPSRDEKGLWIKQGQRDGEMAVFDLIWVLANSNEFMFVQ